MGNETKERLPLRMKPETSRRLEQWYAADNCRSKNEFVEKAINFYVDYLETQDSQSLLPTALLAALDGRLGRLEDHIARREFTREVTETQRVFLIRRVPARHIQLGGVRRTFLLFQNKGSVRTPR